MPPPIDRRTFIRSNMAALGLTAGGLHPFSAHAGATPPNIVFIMADDLGVECLNSYGGTSYRTPHLTRLAEQSMQFSHCFSTPLCTPTRVQVMTGRYPFRTGWTRLIDKRPREDQYLDPRVEITFGQVLKAAGYATAVAGKWQLSHLQEHPHHAEECGFDKHRLWIWKDGEAIQHRYWYPVMWESGRRMNNPGLDYGPDLCCEFLIQFMRQNARRPFFAYYPMILPHHPFFPTPSDGPRPGRMQSDATWFGSMVRHMDTLVGRMMDAVDELGLSDRTLFIFTTDNGTKPAHTSMQNGRMVKGGKGKLSENGCHVPFIARWPGQIPAGTVSNALIDLSDVLPTLAEIGGAQMPQGVVIDGRSFASVLIDGASGSREWVFTQLGGRRAIRDHRWKYVSGGYLYDLQSDPSEQRALLGNDLKPEALAARRRLQALLKQLK
jgi:arylsulfatase A